MPSIETYGMFFYGFSTTVLFLIISVLAYKRLNDENTSIELTKPKKQMMPSNETLFPFNTIKRDMTSQEIQRISKQNKNSNNNNNKTPTENSIIFNKHFWSNHNNNMLGIRTPQKAKDEDRDNEEEKYIIRYSLSNASYLTNTITPQPPHLQMHNVSISNDKYFEALSNPQSIERIHLDRRRSRHSLYHLEDRKRTCLRVTIEYFKEMLRNRSIYEESLKHTWDVATDISVLLKWGKHAMAGTDIDHIDYFPLFWTSLFVQLGYRFISAYAVYKSQKSRKKAMLQVCDLLILREIYFSHIECRTTDTLTYIKKLEAVLEAAPQLILTTYFFLRVGTLEDSYIEIIGWLWSFYTLSTKVINDDTKMYKHIKSRWNKQFIYRMCFRLFEICSRVLILGLVATAVSARAAMLVIVIDCSFLLFSYHNGLLSNDKMNILGSLITFVDLTIYPKVPPLYSWYVKSTNYQRLSKKSSYPPIKLLSASNTIITSTTTTTTTAADIKHLNDIEIGDTFTMRSEDDVKNSPMISQIFESHISQKLNLKITVPDNDKSNIYVKSDEKYDGQKSVRERSSALLKEMASIEAVYLEIQSEERLNTKYLQYKCFGCCCWCKYFGGCLPQCIVKNCVQKCYLLVLCMSWVWCTYFFSFLLCHHRYRKLRKEEAKRKKAKNEDLNNVVRVSRDITVELALIKTEVEASPIPNTPNLSMAKNRLSISERTQQVFEKLKTKKVRFEMPVLLKDRRKKNKTKNLRVDTYDIGDENKSATLSKEFATPNSQTITDSKSVMQIVDFAQKKSADIEEEGSSEEAPDDWWKLGSTKFAVATMKSLHSLDGGFPDLPGLTPLGENKVDPVYPVNNLYLKDETIKEGSDEEYSFASKIKEEKTDAVTTNINKINVNMNSIEFLSDSLHSQVSIDEENNEQNNDNDNNNTINNKIASIEIDFATDSEECGSSKNSKLNDELDAKISAELLTNATEKSVNRETITDSMETPHITHPSSSSPKAQMKFSELSNTLLENITQKEDNLATLLGNMATAKQKDLLPARRDMAIKKSFEFSKSESLDSIRDQTPNLALLLGNMSKERDLLATRRNMAIDKSFEFSKSESLDSSTHSHSDPDEENTDEIKSGDVQVLPARNMAIQKSFEFSASNGIKSGDNTPTLATLLGNIAKEKDLVAVRRNMAIEKSFEMSKTKNSETPKLIPYQMMSMMSYDMSAEATTDTIDTTDTPSGNVTPFVPNELHTAALLALAGLNMNEADRLKKLFTNKSALNTPVNMRSQCSTRNGTPVQQNNTTDNTQFDFPDICCDPTPMSRGVSLYDKSMTITERPKFEQQEMEEKGIESLNINIEASPPAVLNIEIVDSITNKPTLAAINTNNTNTNLSSTNVLNDNETPHFTINTPKVKKIDIKPWCGIQKFIFDRGIVHRYAFLAVLARTMQSWLLLLFITYIVYINPKIFGGKTDVVESNSSYIIACAPWCTSQILRHELKNSFVFMQFVIVCLLCCTFSILFFLLSSPYLLFATSITRSAISLLKSGCIYDSIQYFSKTAKCTPLEILNDFNFMQMFFAEIIKRRIPVFYYEEDNDNDNNNEYEIIEKLQHKILKKADSEILLTAFQLHSTAQLSEYVAIQTIKNGYLHLLQFIMTCAVMPNQDRLIFDPSNCVDEDGNSLLHVAIIHLHGDGHIIQYILNVFGYDQRKNMSNQDVIDLLIIQSDIQVLRIMLEFFKTANRLDLLKKTFFRSIKRGNMEFVIVLMQVLNTTYDTQLWIKSYIDRDRGNKNKNYHVLSNEKTLLMYTAINGHASTTEWLLNTIKVDATKQDREGKTALIHSCMNQNVNVVDIFMKHEHINSYINTTCKKNISALLYATIEGSLDCVRILMQKKRLDPNICAGLHKETALIYASRYGHQEIALQLIKAKKINVNIANNCGKTTLMFAARYGLTKIVKALLGHDDIEVVEKKDNDNKSALDHVEENLYLGDSYKNIKKAIMAHIDSKAKAQHVDPEKLKQKRRSFIMIGELALLQTSNKIKRRYSKSHKNVLKKLKNQKKEKKSKRTKSCLQLELRKRQELAAPLVHLSIDVVEFYLWYSIQMDYDMVCHWLLQNTYCNRDLIGRQDLEMIDIGLVGRNPFHFAVKTGADKCLRILLEIDEMDLPHYVNEKDKEGYTPLIYAVIDGQITIIELLLNYHNTEINESDDNHTTPLMHAAIRGYANIVQLLLNRNHLDVNQVDNKGQSALLLAVRNNRARVVQLLVSNDIDVNKARNNGRTPLMYAVKNGLLDIVKMLLSSNNINLLKKDYIKGNSVWFYVKQCKNHKIRKKIHSLLTFYKVWKAKKKRKRILNQPIILFTLNEGKDSDDYKVNGEFNEYKEYMEMDFYALAAKQVEIKKRANDWNTQLEEIEIEDKLFNKWCMQLEILHICAERHDDTIFKVLWQHWISPESIHVAIQNHHRRNLSDAINVLSVEEIEKQKYLLNEKDHFQSLKWYYFLVMISQKGWPRLFIRFIQEIQHKHIIINWKFVPNDQREIDLMAKHGHIDEMEKYLKKNNDNNDDKSKNKCCSLSNNYIQQKHMKLMLESIFENFGQSAANKPKLGECLRFVLAKTMSQYLFNTKYC